MTETDPHPLRPVATPPDLPGRLWLCAMPGRFEPLEAFLAAARAAGVAHLACLAAPEEIEMKAPAYARARAAGRLPFALHDFPIRDFATPADADAFARLIDALAAKLRAGKGVAIHCAAGIGRTGMAAQRLLQALGLDAEAAAKAVREAGSAPETADQTAFARGPVR